MKAIIQDQYGSADVLQLRDVQRPIPAAGEVLVRVMAAAVNAADWHTMRGDPYLARTAMGFSKPKAAIRGRDFAGRVEAVGSGVTRLRSGDEVYGDTGEAFGTFAEYVTVAEKLVERKPENVTFEQAAAVPLAAGTALVGLCEDAELKAGQHVLINGASGGVGTFAIQIAKVLDAEVTAVCSNRNIELVRKLGADHVIDYTREDFTVNAGWYDVVFDLVGNRTLGELRRAAKPDGALVLSGGGVSNGGSLLGPMGLFFKGQAISRFVRQRVRTCVYKPSRDYLVTLRGFIESGAVTPAIDRVYPLEQAAEAIRYLEIEHARAKVVITI